MVHISILLSLEVVALIVIISFTAIFIAIYTKNTGAVNKGGKGGGVINITASEVTIKGILKSNGGSGILSSSGGSGGKYYLFLFLFSCLYVFRIYLHPHIQFPRKRINTNQWRNRFINYK